MVPPSRHSFLALFSFAVFHSSSTAAFSPPSKWQSVYNRRPIIALEQKISVDDVDNDINAADSWSLSSRRDFTSSIALIVALQYSGLMIGVRDAAAMEPSSDLGSADRPIAIIGGGGRTGMAVAETLAGAEGKMYAVTMTRSGKDPFKGINISGEKKERIRHYPQPVDVKDADAVLAALRDVNASGVVFAASASKKGGNAREVDEVGAGNVAEAAKAVGSRLVLISSMAVDRPDSKSYQVTNDMGGFLDKILDAKLNGENRVRSTMGLDGDYVIIRSGVLMSGKSKSGAADLELNQGDTIGGGLSRDELAGVVVGALKSGKKGVTVEAYRKSTATKLQPDFAIPSGNELTASSYAGLFDSAKSNI